jgi:hypothetical protein
MGNVAVTMIALRDHGLDLSTVGDIYGLFKMADDAKFIPRGYQDFFVKDAWDTPFVWRISKAPTGGMEASLISYGKGRPFDQEGGDGIVFTLPLSGRGKGTLHYGSVVKANWPPSPKN